MLCWNIGHLIVPFQLKALAYDTHLILQITEPKCFPHAAKDHVSPNFHLGIGIVFQ